MLLPEGGPASSRLRAAARWGRSRLERLRNRDTSHRDQYISAYIEARSAAYAHHTAPTTTTTLAAPLPAPHCGSDGRIAFGAWRSPGALLHRSDERSSSRVNARYVTQHNILREARTPAAWAPERLLRGAGLGGVGRSEGEDHDSSSVRRMLRSPVLEEAEWEWIRCQMAKGRRNGTAAAEAEAHLCLLCSVLQHRCWYGGWEEGLLWWDRLSREEEERMATPGAHSHARMPARALLLAIVCEGIRYSSPRLGRPPLEQLTEAVIQAAERCKGNRLPPVVAAPVLSAVGGAVDTPAAAGSHLLRVLDKHLTQLSHDGLRSYLPAVAWGELLHAAARVGCDTSAIQQLTDRITDPTATKGAEKLLRHPLLWAAYIASCGDTKHSMEVFEKNRSSYGIGDHPRVLTAMLRTVLGCGERSASDSSLVALPPDVVRFSEGIFDRLRRLEERGGSDYIPSAASTHVAYALLCDCTRDWQRLQSWLTDYEPVFFTFGIPQSWWEARLPSQWRDASSSSSSSNSVDVCRQLLEDCHNEFPFRLPPAVSYQIDVALQHMKEERVTSERHERDESIHQPALTADALADLMSDDG